ncbi:hypothetical protein DL96DRAFT_1703918 [Flagelloscypha sp. PMI_526]|nr:hypothetical protein DL96DRAFT_1703918 [Flagelloscypha sp. PMI_526]
MPPPRLGKVTPTIGLTRHPRLESKWDTGNDGSSHDIVLIRTPQPQNSPCNPLVPEESSLSSSASSYSSSNLLAEQIITSLRDIPTSQRKGNRHSHSHQTSSLYTSAPRPFWLMVEVQPRLRRYRNCLKEVFQEEITELGQDQPGIPPKPSSFQGGRKRASERERELEMERVHLIQLLGCIVDGIRTSLTPVDPTATLLPNTTQSATASLVSNLPSSTSLSPPGSKRTSLSPGSSIIGMWNALTHPSGAASSTSAASSGGASDDGNEWNGKGHRKRISFAEQPEGTSSSTIRIKKAEVVVFES